MGKNSNGEKDPHFTGRVAFWIILTLLVWSLIVVIFSGELTLLGTLRMMGGWLKAIPAPTEHWATILAAWAWPLAALLIAYWLRRPLARATHIVAERMGTDDLNFWGLGVKRGAWAIPLDPKAAAAGSSSFTPEDVERIERLYEFAGDSSENAGRLTDWISTHVDPKLDPVDFLSEPVFALDRLSAYTELIGAE